MYLRTSATHRQVKAERKHTFGAIGAAVDTGVKYVYYTSLAFGPESGAGVMRAHLLLGEGLYNESWPLYLGYFDPQRDERGEVLLAGEGKFSWTAIKDLGLGSALVLADGMENFVGKTLYLSRTGAARCLREIAELVAKAKGESVSVKVVGTEEYVEHYVKRGVKKSSIEWWSSTYRALEKGECLIEDPTLGELLAGRGVKPTSVKETVEDMLKHRVNDQRDT
ncbi:hypothetical protein B2J93_1141 [Marssonina coronariae]|uniref:NmrA-like domain-containing protein n=1 Tax=Diplocarpon coronariae TaxID=2795749 RepID=A0A218YUH7_9HELO|nr:hypothetical protein B2J93_1141 [Marssonina coronariae]